MNDQRGHLIAASLGGPNDVWNFAPQSGRINCHHGRISFWRLNEREMLNFVRNTGGYVDHTVRCIYDDDLHSRRPLGFEVEVIYYDSNGIRALDSAGTRTRDESVMYFSNDPVAPGQDEMDFGRVAAISSMRCKTSAGRKELHVFPTKD